MITAVEARRAASGLNGASEADKLTLHNHITYTADCGCTEAILSCSLFQKVKPVIDELKANGYRVEHQIDPRDGDFLKIYW